MTFLSRIRYWLYALILATLLFSLYAILDERDAISDKQEQSR